MAKAKLNSDITRFLGGVTQGKLGKKNITVQVGRIDNAVLGTDGKPKVRYRLVVNGKESKYLIRSWQGAYQVHQIVASGDAKEIFTQAGDLKKGMTDIIGTDAIRSVFDYICPINLYSKNELAKKAVNTSIKVGNPKKDKAWEQFVEFQN
tara:strand:+ start:216 stop:665 length:450 start_codon:yes stop_codon:yes gene_type:complete